MSDKLIELEKNVNDEKSFLLFAKELVKDRGLAVKNEKNSPSAPYGPDAGGWENTTIEHYLERAIAWAEDSEFGRRMGTPEFELKDTNEWRRFAAFLMAGIVYE